MNYPFLPRWFLLGLVCWFQWPDTPASAEIVRWLLPVADTALRESEPNHNLGAAQSLPVGVSGNGSPRNRALLTFDFSPVPVDAVFSSVTLHLPVTQVGENSPATVFELRRVLQPWNEGSKPWLAATFGEATWIWRSHQQFLWGTGGGQIGADFATEVSATGVLAGAGTVTDFSAPGLIADAHYWNTNRLGNFGWVLMAQGEPAGSGKQVGSREHAVSQPVLELRYRSFSLYDIMDAGGAVRFSFDADSNQTYAVEFRELVHTGDWTVLTNIPALPADSTIHLTNQPESSLRFFRLRKP
jgi:hypothetical protein